MKCPVYRSSTAAKLGKHRFSETVVRAILPGRPELRSILPVSNLAECDRGGARGMSGDQQLTSLIGEIYDVPIDEVRRPILYLKSRCVVQDYRRSRRSGTVASPATQRGADPVPKSQEERVCIAPSARGDSRSRSQEYCDTAVVPNSF